MDVVKCPYCGSELVFYDELEDYIFGTSRYTAIWRCRCHDCDEVFTVHDFYNYEHSEVYSRDEEEI